MIAFVFPGQGSQAVGMGKDLAESFHRVRNVFQEADESLGFSLSRLCFEGPAEELQQTANAQPAILTLSIAILRELENAAGIAPEVVAGHSLGEYSALVCAGAMSFADALRLVRRRGELMQEAVALGQGAMAAVLNLDPASVEELCREAAGAEVVCPANYNEPRQTVISGHADAVARAMQLATQRGGACIRLKVSAPFHCPLMEPAATRLAELLRGVSFSPPRMPVIRNLDAQPYQDSSGIAEALTRQVTSPVRWTDTIRQMVQMGVTDIVEVGPGTVLTNLTSKIDERIRRLPMGTQEQVFCCHRVLDQARRQSLLDAGWTAKGKLLISPDRRRMLMEHGGFWTADPDRDTSRDRSDASSRAPAPQ